jgi:hypothetical protein
VLGFLINIEKKERRLSNDPGTLTHVSIKGDIYFAGFPSSMYQMPGAAVPGRERFRLAMGEGFASSLL